MVFFKFNDALVFFDATVSCHSLNDPAWRTVAIIVTWLDSCLHKLRSKGNIRWGNGFLLKAISLLAHPPRWAFKTLQSLFSFPRYQAILVEWTLLLTPVFL